MSRAVLVANPDGSGILNLTNRPEDEREPVWSPDGSRIAYAYSTATFVMNADGSGRNLLALGASGHWSPDGRTVVVARRTHQYWPYNTDIYTFDEDAGFVNLIGDPRDGYWDSHPVWSPDGSQIAFVSDRVDVRRHEIFTVRPDGTGLRRVTYGGGSYPDWSPDGTKILFSRRGWYPQGSALYTVNPDGSGERRLTDHAQWEFKSMGVWSPDGTKILFIRSAGGSSDIWVMNADGSGERLLIEDGESPDWQPLVNRPPECGGVLATPGVLTKVNRELVPVELTGASDPDGDPVSLRVESVTQDEPVVAPGDDTSPDAVHGPVPGALSLRAERNPHGDGRVYRVRFEATDPDGASCTGVAAAAVERHKGVAAVDSAPPSHDSLGS